MTKIKKTTTDLDRLHSRITALGQQCDTWQDGLYKSSNAELYSILQGCFDLLTELRTASSLRKKFSKALEMAGYTVQANTSLTTQIVRAVFKSEKHRTYGYARVLNVAFEEKHADQSLADFIVAKGGVEEIRRTPKNGVSVTEQRQAYKDLAEEALASVPALCNVKARTELMPHPDATNDFAVVLVRRNPDGNIGIVFGTNKPSLVEAVLAEAGKTLSEQKLQQATISNQIARRKQREVMLDEIAA